jgi:hypothetical protein
MNKTQKILSLNYKFTYLDFGLTEYRTYFLSSALIIGSVLLPHAFHQFHLAGQVFLPIYFFVLIGAYKFGYKVGVITGIFSPLISFFLTGMPMLMILPFVIVKGIILGLIAGFFVTKFRKLSMLSLFLVVISYQSIGFLIVYLFTHNLNLSTTDLILGYPGLILQVVGGYTLLRLIGGYDGKKFETNSK